MRCELYVHFSDAFVVLGERGLLNHVMGGSDEGIPLQSCPMCGPTLVVRHEHHVVSIFTVAIVVVNLR